MQNSVNLDEVVRTICLEFLKRVKCPEDKRTPNNLWRQCADFVHEKIAKLFGVRKVDCSVMRNYMEIYEECDKARGVYFKRMLKDASRKFLEQEQQNRDRRNERHRENTKRRKTAQPAAQLAPQRPQRVEAGCGLFYNQDLLGLILPQLTLQEAARLLAGTCTQMAQIVRGDTIPWKLNTAVTLLEYDLDHCYDYDVRYLLERVYPWFKNQDLSPYTEWLMTQVCRQRTDSEERWHVFFRCILHAEPEAGEYGIARIVQPNKVSEILARNMQDLNRIIEQSCLRYVSPFCWKEWDSVPTWCESVQTAFGEWGEKLPFEIDVRRIRPCSILARICEETFEGVKENIDILIDDKTDPFRNWNHFAFTFLTECHKLYQMPEYEEWNDDYTYVGNDFERDEGPDYGLPDQRYAEQDEDQEDEDD